MIREKLLDNKFILVLLALVTFTLPFERIPTLEIYSHTVKMSYVFSLVLLIAVLFGDVSRLFREYKLALSDWFLLAFGLYAFLTLFRAHILSRSIIIVALWLFMFAIYLIFSRLFRSERAIALAEKAILLSTILVCIFGLYQFIGDTCGLPLSWIGLRPEYNYAVMGFTRIQSTGLEPLYFANFLLVPLYLSINKLLQNKNKLLYFGISVLILINIILTVSRGAYIAVGFSMLFFVFILLINNFKQRKVLVVTSVLGVIIVAVLLSFFTMRLSLGSQAVISAVNHSVKVADNIAVDDSAYPANRASNYAQAGKLFKDNLILGGGVGNFGALTTKQADKQVGRYNIVNNEYIEIVSETGLIGLVLFSGFVLCYLNEARRGYLKQESCEKLSTLCLFCGLLAVCIQYNFFSTLYIIYIWVFLALLKGRTYVAKVPEN